MRENKIAEYRAQAEACLAHAERTQDFPSKQRWLQLAEAWSQLADNIPEAGAKKTDNP